MKEKNKGWRLDYFVASGAIKSSIASSYILKDVAGSDHCPIGLVVHKNSVAAALPAPADQAPATTKE